MIALLIVLIATVMIVWFGFLGWGMLEMVRALSGLINGLWVELV